MSYLIGQRIEHYQIEALLGEGGMGTVYRAVDLRQDQMVAVKVMHHHLAQKPQFLRRFTQEAQATRDFNNPHVIKVYDHGVYQDMPYLVMEYIAGGSLTAYISQLRWGGKRIALADVLQITGQIADGLSYAHQHGVVHRDIKPQNIMLRQRRVGAEQHMQAVITDFGVAVMLREDEDVSTNPFMGSLPYMSPEQCANLRLDGRSDIYSLGILLYQLTTGQLPFKIEAPADIVKHLEEAPIPPHFLNPDIPEAVERIILKSLSKRPEERYQTATEMVLALRQVDLSKQTVTAQAAHELDERVVTQWIEKRWVAGIDMRNRIDVQQTWTSEGFYRLFIAHQWEEARIAPLVKDTLTIGRYAHNDIVLDDKSVSGQHALLERTADGWQVRDLGSTNGAYLDHVQLQFDQPLPWQPHQTLRIGSYAMQWQPFGGQRQALRVAAGKVAAGVPASPPPTNGKHQPGSQVAAVAAAGGAAAAGTAAILTAAPRASGSAILGVKFAREKIEVIPGQEAFMPVTITNHGSTVEDIDLYLTENEQPPTWITLTETAVKLMPDESKTVQINIRPPENESVLAGAHVCQVTAVADVTEIATDRITVHVAPFAGFALDMHPTRLQEKTECRLTIRDRSNVDNKYEIVGLDESDALAFRFDEPQNATLVAFDEQRQEVRIPAGTAGMITYRVGARKKPWLRAPERAFPFKIRVRIGSAEDWQTLEGQIEIQPRISRRVLFLFLFTLLFLGLIGFVGYRQIQAANAAKVAELEEETAKKDEELLLAQSRVDGIQEQIDALLQQIATAPEDAALLAQLNQLQSELNSAQAEVAQAQGDASTALEQLTEAQEQANAQVLPPIDILLDVNTITENSPIGTTIGFFTAIIAEESALPNHKVAARTGGAALQQPVKINYVYTLTSGDTSAFLISRNELKTAVAFDFETKNRYTVGIQVDNGFGGTFSKQFTITVADVDDTPRLVISELTVNEGVGAAAVVVTMNGVSNTPVTVDVSTADGTAVKDKDYTASKGSITWSPGESGDKTFSVPIIDDDADEPDETFTVTLANAQNGIIETGTAQVTITDNDDAPTIAIANVTVTEAAGKATFSATLTGKSAADVTVTYATNSGTATAGADFTPTNGTLTWKAGESGDKTIDVTILEDIIDEPDEKFTLTLSNPSNATLSVNEATATITDNDNPPTISIADMTVPESVAGGSAAITVVMEGLSGQDVTVTYTTADGTARAGRDYTAVTGSLTWKAGETGVQTFAVPIIEDNIHEPTDETFKVLLSNPINGSIRDAEATITITDNDTLPGITVADVTVDESAQTAVITVILTGGSSLGASVDYATANNQNSATAGADYVPLNTPAPLSWGPDETGTRTFAVSILEDKIDEPAETFRVVLSNPQNARLDDPEATVTILDNDNLPVLNVADVSASEADNSVIVTVSLSGGSSEGVTVAYNTASTGSATPNSDYIPTDGTLTWEPNEVDATRTFLVTIINDNIFETNETFNVVLSNPQNAEIGDGTGVVTITDNDTIPTLAISANRTVGENAGTITLTVQMNGGHHNGVTVQWATVDTGSATGGSDYSIDSGTLTWLANETDATRAIPIRILEDDFDENNETFRVTLSVASNATIANASAIITITDNDTAGITLTPEGGVTVGEGGPNANYNLVLTSRPTATVTINFNTGAQIEPMDPLVIIPANWNNPQTITVRAVDDDVAEGTHTGVISHTVISADPNYSARAVPNVTVTITDNDNVGIIPTPTAINVTEGGAGSSYTLVLTSRPNGNVTISFNTGDQLQTIGNAIFTPGNWNTAQTINVQAIDDDVDEGEHTGVILHSVSSSDPGYNGFTIPDVTATITDNDIAGVTLTQTGGSTDVSEDGDTDTYTLVLDTQPEANVTIQFNPGTQLQPITSITFTPANWHITRTVTVAAVDDNVDETSPHTGTIIHAINTTDSKYAAVAIPNLTVNITDNDTGGITVVESGGNTAVTEGGPNDTYTLVLNTQPTGNVVISFNTGTQIQAIPNATFTPANWNTPQTITVIAVDDPDAEGNHNGTIAHTVASGDSNYNGMAVPNITVAITDNDIPGVTIVESGGSTAVTEGGATDTYTLVLNTRPASLVTISFNTGSQLQPIANISFNPGNWNTPQTVVVQAIDDAINEGNHTGTIIHTVTSGDVNYNGLAVPNITVAITDNDVPAVTIVESGGSTNVTEGGASDSYTVVLTSEPTGNVTISFNTGAQIQAIANLTFTPGNWSVAQIVTVFAVDDAVAEGNHIGLIIHTAASSDANYNGIAISNVTVNITDNDSAGVTLVESGGSTNVTEGGATDTYTLVLTSQPTGNVTISFNAGSQLQAIANIIFTPANWNTAQTITVSAVNDAVAEGPHVGQIIHTATSGDANYNGITIPNVTVNITDNDNAGVTVAPTTVNVTEGGPNSSYTIVLTSQPTANVTISFNTGTQVQGIANITFTPANWNVAQTITVIAVDDVIVEGPHVAQIVHSALSGDDNYNSIPITNVTVNITDND